MCTVDHNNIAIVTVKMCLVAYHSTLGSKLTMQIYNALSTNRYERSLYTVMHVTQLNLFNSPALWLPSEVTPGALHNHRKDNWSQQSNYKAQVEKGKSH